MSTSTASHLGVAVAIPCHSEQRWSSIVRATESVGLHSLKPLRVILAVDHNVELAARLQRELTNVTVVLNDGPRRGASATRNAGASVVATRFTAFLDDDETADTDSLEKLPEPFADPSVVGTGGSYRPVWAECMPRWFPDEFAWTVGGAYTGLPTTPSPVRNVWSGNMAVRTEVLQSIGGFRTDFGKLGRQNRPEDTELCIRMSRASDSGKWVHVPDAVIDHDVPADRTTRRFFISRCFGEGKGKIEMGRHLREGETAALDSERSYLARTIPRGVARDCRDGGDGFLRAAAILAGISAAGLGALSAVTRPRSGRSPATHDVSVEVDEGSGRP